MKHIRQHTKRILRHVRRELSFVVLMGIVSLALYAYIPHLDNSFESPEVKFADASPSGLSIVPASCPSDTHGGLYSCTCGEWRECGNSTTNYWYYGDGGLCDIEYCTGGAVCQDGTTL